MTSSLLAWTLDARWSASGASDSPSRGFLASRLNLGAADPPSCPLSVVFQVEALACELPHRLQLPLSRLSLSEIRREVITQGLVAEISGGDLVALLSADALRPWRHRGWIFPRDPDFAAKAGRILDLYDRVWQGRPLNTREFVISADETSSIQARRRKQPTLAPAPGRSTRVEHEYFRKGAWTYLAAWDVHRTKVFGRCEKKNGIAPLDRLIENVMNQEPYKSARRVFWIMDNYFAHRGQRAVDRLRSQSQRSGYSPGENREQTVCSRGLTLFRLRHRNSEREHLAGETEGDCRLEKRG